MRCWCNSIGKWKATCVACLVQYCHSSLKQHAADAEKLKKPASHSIDSGEQRLSPITGILKQALSCFHVESYGIPMSSVHVVLRDLGCLKLHESGALSREVPGDSRHSWALQMWI